MLALPRQQLDMVDVTFFSIFKRDHLSCAVMSVSTENVAKHLSFNRLGMMHQHYLAVVPQIAPRNARERAEYDFFTAEYERYRKRAQQLMGWRLLLYGILYVSILVNVLKLIPFLGALVQLIVSGGIALPLIVILSMRINLHMQRLEGCMYHLVTLYQLNPKRDTVATLERIKKVI